MYNKITLVGRLTADPELRYTSTGNAVCRYGLAVSRSYKNSQGQKETDFFNIVTWRKLGEISARYLKKGKLVLIEGEMQSHKYTPADGPTKTIWEVHAKDMKMLSPKGETEVTGYGAAAAPAGIKDSYQGQDAEGDEYNGPDIEDIDFNDCPF